MGEPGDHNHRPLIIIDEILCYIVNEISLRDFDTIANLCENNFDAAAIEKSRDLLFELCHNENDETKPKGRKGEHKKDRILKDIYNLLQEKGDDIPVFVAKDLNVLPPVNFKSLDVSVLLHNIRTLQTEVELLKKGMDLQKQTSKDTHDITKKLDERINKIEKQRDEDVGVRNDIVNKVNEFTSKLDTRVNELKTNRSPDTLVESNNSMNKTNIENDLESVSSKAASNSSIIEMNESVQDIDVRNVTKRNKIEKQNVESNKHNWWFNMLDMNDKNENTNNKNENNTDELNHHENTTTDVLRLRGPLNPQAIPYVEKHEHLRKQPSFATITKRQNTSEQNDYIVDKDGFILVGADGRPVRTKPVQPVVNVPQDQRPLAPGKPRNPGIVGNSSRNGPAAAERIVKANIFATRYTPNTTSEEVKHYLLSDDRLQNLNIMVEKVESRYDTYASFHITCVCLKDIANEFFNPDLWPRNILVRQWREKRVQRNVFNNHYGRY